MPLKNQAELLFNRVKTHQLQKEVGLLSTDIQVDAGVVQVFGDQNGDIGLWIPISDEEHRQFRPDTRSAALRLTAPHVDGVQHIRLALTEPRQERIFVVFVDEILSTLESNPNNPASTVSSMLKRWRDLFRESLKPITWSREQDLGLLCELEVLLALYERQIPSLLERWTGPEGLPHDFELETESLECKATRSMNGLKVSINGVAQLNPTPGKELRLIARSYTENPDGEISVDKMLDKIFKLDGIDTDVLVRKLQKLGCPYLSKDGKPYFNQYDAVESFEFQVNDEFPRITNIGPAERIQQVSYVLDLSGPSTVPGYLTKNLLLQNGEHE